jgi:hypothetical protein
LTERQEVEEVLLVAILGPAGKSDRIVDVSFLIDGVIATESVSDRWVKRYAVGEESTPVDVPSEEAESDDSSLVA